MTRNKSGLPFNLWMNGWTRGTTHKLALGMHYPAYFYSLITIILIRPILLYLLSPPHH